MFELKRSPKINEEVKIGDEIITVALDIDEITIRFRKCMADLSNAEKAIAKAQAEKSGDLDKVMTEYGNATIALLQVIFGDDDANKILAFYENRYLEMTSEVFPFIAQTIIPKIEAAATEKKNKLINLYKGRR